MKNIVIFQICNEFIEKWKETLNGKQGEIKNFTNEILKWNLESMCYNIRILIYFVVSINIRVQNY